jgi:hypothetical protein
MQKVNHNSFFVRGAGLEAAERVGEGGRDTLVQAVSTTPIKLAPTITRSTYSTYEYLPSHM